MLLLSVLSWRVSQAWNPPHTRFKFHLEKLKDHNVLENFQAMIGGRFAPLTIMNSEDADMDTMITTFNTAVTEIVSEILGKHCPKKKPLVTAKILDLCDERREPRKKLILKDLRNTRK